MAKTKKLNTFFYFIPTYFYKTLFITFLIVIRAFMIPIPSIRIPNYVVPDSKLRGSGFRITCIRISNYVYSNSELHVYELRVSKLHVSKSRIMCSVSWFRITCTRICIQITYDVYLVYPYSELRVSELGITCIRILNYLYPDSEFRVSRFGISIRNFHFLNVEAYLNSSWYIPDNDNMIISSRYKDIFSSWVPFYYPNSSSRNIQ